MIEHVSVRVLPGGRDGRGIVDRRNAAIALGRSPKTLADWKIQQVGPPARQIGGRIFYDWADIEDYMAGKG